jgi:hypothetical protein
MCTVLDAPQIEHAVVLERAECDSVIAAARHAPSFEFESQRLGEPAWPGAEPTLTNATRPAAQHRPRRIS